MLSPQKHKIFPTIASQHCLKAQAWFKNKSYFYLAACTSELRSAEEAVALIGGFPWEATSYQGPERGHWLPDYMQKKGLQAGRALPCYLGRAPKGGFFFLLASSWIRAQHKQAAQGLPITPTWTSGCSNSYKINLQQRHHLQEQLMAMASSSLPWLLGYCFPNHPRLNDCQYMRVSKLLLMTVACRGVDSMVPDGALKMVLTHRRKGNNEILSY